MTCILHDSPKKNRFIGAVQGGNPVPIAAASFRIPRSTSYKLWNKYKTTGSTHALPRSGRPPVVTPHLKRRVAHEIRKDRKAHFREIGQLVKPTISATTVRAIADENGIHRRVARKVPFLRPEHRRDRRVWASQFVGWSEDDWRTIIWSDEAYICLGDGKGTVYVSRTGNEALCDGCTIPTFKQSSIRIMVWGCIMADRKGPLRVLEYPGGTGGGMTSERYQDQVLHSALYDFYWEETENRGFVAFQQDGA